MEVSMSETSQETNRDWTQAIKQQIFSGKSAVQWCREQNFPYRIFLYQRSRLLKTEVFKKTFVELHEDSDEPSWIEITTFGAKLILANKFNKFALIRLLEVLKRL